MEKVATIMEKLMANRICEIILGLIAVIAPLYFLKTVYVVWFGPYEIFFGFKSEKWTWLVLTSVDFVGLLTLLPSRKKGRVMQIVLALWTLEMLLVFIATLVR